MIITRTQSRAESKVRAPRYRIDRELIVSSKTIGTAVAYPLRTDNVSKSGFLLTWTAGSRVPFIENTILEMTIDPNSQWLEVPVHCLGKVVRKKEKAGASAMEPSEVQFGVRIVQIDNEDLANWDLCLENLSERVAPLVTAEIPKMLLQEQKIKRSA